MRSLEKEKQKRIVKGTLGVMASKVDDIIKGGYRTFWTESTNTSTWTSHTKFYFSTDEEDKPKEVSPNDETYPRYVYLGLFSMKMALDSFNIGKDTQSGEVNVS